jgi:hypothetical protein
MNKKLSNLFMPLLAVSALAMATPSIASEAIVKKARCVACHMPLTPNALAPPTRMSPPSIVVTLARRTNSSPRYALAAAATGEKSR